MQTEIRELPHTEVPRPLIYTTAVICGVLAAMAVQILLDSRGIELTGMWRNLFSAQALQPILRSSGKRRSEIRNQNSDVRGRKFRLLISDL